MFLKIVTLLPILLLYASNLAAQNIDSLLAEQMLQRAKTYQAGNQFDLALSSADSSVTAFSAIFGRRNVKTAEALEVMLKLKNTLGEYAPALELAKEVLDIREALLPPEHPQIAYAMNNIGILSDALGDSRTGLFYKLRALAILEKTSPEITEDILKSYLNIGASYMDLSENDSAEHYLESGLRMTYEYFGSGENIFTGYYFTNLGITYENQGFYQKAREMKEKALEVRLKLHGEIHPDVGAAYANLANSFQLAGDISSAIELSKKALNIFQQVLGNRHPVTGQLYNNLSACYDAVHDYKTAADHAYRALDIYSATLGEVHPYIAQTYNNLAAILGNLGKHEQSVETYKKSIQIYEATLGSEDPTTASTIANMGVPLERLGRYDEACENYRYSIRVLEKVYGPDHFYLSFPYTGLGNVYASQKEFDLSLGAFDTALMIKKQALGYLHPEVALSQINVANIKVYMGRFSQALENYNDVVKLLTSPEISVPIAQTHFLKSKALEGAAVTLKKLYKSTTDTMALWKSSEYIWDAMEEIKAQKLLDYSQESEKMTGPSLVQIAENGLQIYFEMDKLQSGEAIQAFSFSEIVKAFQLIEVMQESDAAAFVRLPSALIQHERQLNRDIYFYEKQIFEQAHHEDLLPVWRKILVEKKATKDSLLTILKSEFPDYFTAKYNLSTITVEEVQREMLRPNEALLEYFVGDSSIFVFVVKPDDYQVVEVKKDFPLEAWVDTLRHNIYQNRSTVSEDYVQAAADLYDKLVRPVAGLLPERLIVIPDGVLGYVPFDALLTGRPKDLKRPDRYDYLLKKHQISYCYSATLLKKMRERQHRHAPSKEFVAFSPYYTGSVQELEYLQPFQFSPDSLYAGLRSWTPSMADELQASAAEVKTITKKIGGDAFYGSEATEARFDSIAGQYRIVHLATHGIADNRVGDYSFLAFYILPDSVENELLYVRDLYNLELNADMVVLSACETGLGELQRGEGIISLARAFAYAGAKSIVNTLWKVDDNSTGELMVLFYGYLKDGKDKDEALRLAKLAYIKQHGKRAMPFFWAGVIPVGDMGAVWEK